MKTVTTPWVITSVPWPWGILREIFWADCSQTILVMDGPTFQVAALLSLVPVALLWSLHGPSGQKSRPANEKPKAKLTLKDSFKALLEPELATVVVVALFLNLLHQMSGVFISLYGLAVGMTLT